jgi:hypothetical protein
VLTIKAGIAGNRYSNGISNQQSRNKHGKIELVLTPDEETRGAYHFDAEKNSS